MYIEHGQPMVNLLFYMREMHEGVKHEVVIGSYIKVTELSNHPVNSKIRLGNAVCKDI
jgi:hypothetical protein